MRVKESMYGIPRIKHPPSSYGLIPAYLDRQFNRWKDQYIPTLLSMYKPFLDPNPCRIIGSPKVISFGYRCLPSDKFPFLTIRLPESMDLWNMILKALPLRYIRTPMLERQIMSIYSRVGRGLLDYILARDWNPLKISFDFLILADGWADYFIVTLCLGVGLTVWHRYDFQDDLDCLVYDSLEFFQDSTRRMYGFEKISFIEEGSYDKLLMKIMDKVYPFNEIDYEGLFPNDWEENPPPVNKLYPPLFGLATMMVLFVACALVPNEAMALASGIHI